MLNKGHQYIALILSVVLFSCSISGPVDTVLGDSRQEVVSPPGEYSPVAADLASAYMQLTRFDESFGAHTSLSSALWQEFLNWQQAYDTARAQQERIEDELESTGELILEHGGSYSIDLESYCVHGGEARPVTGDGLRLAPLRGAAKNWIPEILKSQGVKKLSQDRVQYLIWSLLADVKFDELDDKHQATLLQFYPDAAVRFGNRRLSDLAENLFSSEFPWAIDELNDLRSLRSLLLEKRYDFESLVERMAPPSNRLQPIPVGWLKMEEGYFVRATSDSYRRVHFDIYVPEGPDRNPNAVKNLVFRPWEWVALPDKGQRLGISSRVIRAPKKKIKYDICESLKKWRPKECRALSDEDRKAILSAAGLEHFSKTRYRSPPKSGTSPEEETDCSHFVNDIYRRANFPFQYSPTSTMECLSIFKEIGESDARPGDLVLYLGHIGILDNQGMVISATRGGPGRRSMRGPKDPGFIPAVTRQRREQAGHGKSKIIRWSCP